jgi:DNA-binding NarL/FixJ family response regulator
VTIRVLVVDDQAMVREGLRMILDLQDDIEVVAEAGDGQAALQAVAEHRPDVVLMDIRMPGMNGLQATERLLRGGRPGPRVLVLTTFGEDEYLYAALRAGASGFLLKDTPPAQIVEAVRRVAAGDPILSPAITRRLMDRAATQADAHTIAQDKLQRLSPREYDVMLAVAQGKANAQIGAELFMSLATVKAHISHILTKLELGNRTQIALLAHDAGLA